MATGKCVSLKRGYSLYQWTGDAAKPWSVAPHGTFESHYFDTREEAESFIGTAPTLREVTATIRFYVPVPRVEPPKLNIPEPFALVPPTEKPKMFCVRCGDEVEFWNGQLASLLEDGVDPNDRVVECEDEDTLRLGKHALVRSATQNEIQAWLEFNVGANGTLSGDNPLVNRSLNVHDVYIGDIRDLD